MKRGSWACCATRRARASLVLVAVVLLGACAERPNVEPTEYRVAKFASLELPARPRGDFASNRSIRMPVPPRDGSVEWRPVPLPARVTGSPRSATGPRGLTVHWYRVDHPVDRGHGPIAVYVPRFLPGVGQVDLFVAGEHMDVPATRIASYWNRPALVPIPSRLVEGRASVDVVVAVSFDTRTGYSLTPVWVGELPTLQRAAALRDFLQNHAPEALSYAFLALGLFAFGFWVRRPREQPYLLFALATVVWWVRTLHFYVDAVPIDGRIFWWLSVISLSWLMVLVYLFALRFQGRQVPWVERALLVFVVGASVATYPTVHLEPALASTLIYAVQLVASIGVTFLITRDAVRARTREGLVLAAALWIDLLFGAYDLLLKDAYVDPRGVFLLPYGAIPLFGAFLYAVLRRYGGAIDDVERLNASLEERLAARTRELDASHQRLRAIEREQALTAERQRLMRDMHDGLGSSLMSSLVLVERGKLQPGEVAAVLRECIDDLKLTIDSLEPIGSDLVTLLATLRYRLGRRLEGAGLKLDWRVSDLPPLPWLDALSALEVLRILQEALTNVVKHSGARSIAISTAAAGNEVRVLLVDDGHGFDVERARRNPAGRGLLNLERRAAKLGGRVRIDSSPAGTSVELALRIERRDVPSSAAPGEERRSAGERDAALPPVQEESGPAVR